MSDTERPDYLWDGSDPADPEIQRLESLLRPFAIQPRGVPAVSNLGAGTPAPAPRSRRPWRWAIAATALAAGIAAAIVGTRPLVTPCGAVPGLAFRGVGGPVRCGGALVAHGNLPVGEWLETGSGRAEIVVARVGTVRVDPGSRVQLRRTGAREQRLALQQGRIEARVTAPPRLFVVETPGVTVWDLGCAYTLDVDRHGIGRLAVTEGQVELSHDGDTVVVPARTTASFDRRRGLGLPIATDASAELVDAVARFDRGERGAADDVIRWAGPGGELTLVHLLASRRTTPAERQRGAAALARLSPPPASVAAEQVVAGDADAIGRWCTPIVESWMAQDGRTPASRKKKQAP